MINVMEYPFYNQDTQKIEAFEVRYKITGEHIPTIRDVSPEEFPELEILSANDAAGNDRRRDLSEKDEDRIYQMIKED